MEIFATTDAVMVFRLVLSVLLGALVGFEREYFGKAAGFRTYSLVSLGACLFTVTSLFGIGNLPQPGDYGEDFRYNYDPTRIISNIVVGIGFLGAGLIIFRGFRVEGLTTAAGLWVAAAIGAAVGFGFYLIAIVAALLELFAFYVLKRAEPHEHKDDVFMDR